MGSGAPAGAFAPMNDPTILALLQNAILLVAMVSIFDLFLDRQRRTGKPLSKALVGLALGFLGVALIKTAYELEPGIVFDTRSVLLAVTGLFFGWIPTSVAMVLIAAYRLAQGGTAAVAGALVVLVSGGLGLAWRHARRQPRAALTAAELYVFGLAVHLAVLACMLLLPWPHAQRVLAAIGLPMLLICPLATSALGLLLANRLRRDAAAVALAESETRYRSMFEDSHAPMLIIDPANQAIVDANVAAGRFYGWSREELRRMSITQINDLPLDHLLGALGRARSHPPDHFFFPHRLADGSIREVEVFTGPVVMAGRQLLYSIIHDVTQRRRAEAALLASERKWREVLVKVPLIAVSLDAEGRVVLANNHFLKLTGWKIGEVLGRDWFELAIPESSRATVRHVFTTTTTSGRLSEFDRYENEILTRNGEPRRVAWSNVLAKNAQGRVVEVTSLGVDLTEPTRREATLRASEHRLNQAERLAHLGSWETVFSPTLPEGRQLIWSDETFRIFGHQPGAFEVTYERFLDQVHPDDRAAVQAAVESAIPTHQSYRIEHRVIRPDGSERIVLEQAEFIGDASPGQPLRLIGTVQDVTEQRHAEKLLRKLARAVEQSPVSIVVTDHNGTIEFVNPYFTQVTGYPPEEVLGKNPRFLKSGETPAAEYQRLWTTVLAGKEWRGTFRNRRKDGTFLWETALISPVRDPEGKITHFISIKEDITEKRLLEARLLRAQRMESIGNLAGGIAHDLNNILAPILMAVPLLREDESPELRRALIQTIESSAQRAASVVRQLLGFGRGREGARQPVQAAQLLRETTKIARETFPRNIEIIESHPADLWPIIADSTQIHQVLLNLCLNSRDAMPDGGRLELRAENTTLDEHFAALDGRVTAGPYVRLSVSDSGHGIPEAIQDHIFDSFFTTKPENQGTGLGLTTAQGIVQEHGGSLQFTSREDAGTTFQVLLPAHPDSAVPSKTPTPDPTPAPALSRGHGERLLVVDDEPSILETLRRTLEHHGYRVLTARNGAQALAEFDLHADDIQAVITDVMMPEMDGVALCRALRELRPDLPLVVSSGGLFGKAGGDARLALDRLGIRHIVHKPHNADVLLHTVAEALKRPEDPSEDANNPYRFTDGL